MFVVRGVVSIDVLMAVFLFMKMLQPYPGVTINVILHVCSLCFLNKGDAGNDYETIVPWYHIVSVHLFLYKEYMCIDTLVYILIYLDLVKS